MNFAGNAKGRDLIVYFGPATSDIEDAKLKPGVYVSDANSKLDEIVFNRAKGAYLGVAASQFKPNLKNATVLPVDKRDAQPYLYCTRVNGHLTHYRDKPDSPEFIRNIFQTAGRCELIKTDTGYMIGTAIKADIRKFSNGNYGIDRSSVQPVKWEITKGMMERQLKATQEANKYVKSKPLTPVERFMAEDETTVPSGTQVEFP